MKAEKKRAQRLKKIRRIRWNISGTKERPRLCIYRSLKHIYGQVINDDVGNTLVSESSLNLDQKDKSKKEIAAEVGKALAEKCLEQGIKNIVFDRHGCPYHGRIRSLAESARKAGLEF